MRVHAGVRTHSHHFVFSDFGSCRRPQGNNTPTHWGLCFHFCTLLPSVALRGKHCLCTSVPSLQWTAPHLCLCLQSSAWIYCFRCQGFLSLDATPGLHDCFMQRRWKKIQKTCKQTCATKLPEPSIAHVCCAVHIWNDYQHFAFYEICICSATRGLSGIEVRRTPIVIVYYPKIIPGDCMEFIKPKNMSLKELLIPLFSTSTQHSV